MKLFSSKKHTALDDGDNYDDNGGKATPVHFKNNEDMSMDQSTSGAQTEVAIHTQWQHDVMYQKFLQQQAEGYEMVPPRKNNKGWKLVKQLNCASSKKDRSTSEQEQGGKAKVALIPSRSIRKTDNDEPWEASFPEHDDEKEEEGRSKHQRQVLITVKEGNQLVATSKVNPRSRHQQDETATLYSPSNKTYTKLSSQQLGRKPQVRDLTVSKSNRHRGTAVTLPTNAQRAARWLSGVENGGFKKEDYIDGKKVQEKGVDDSAFFDEDTGVSVDDDDNTRFTFYTDYTGNTNGSGGYTTDTTDASSISDNDGSPNGRGITTASKAERRRVRRHERYLEEDVPLFQAVADDLGLVAKFLVADGSACLSCVADTTRDSVQTMRR